MGPRTGSTADPPGPFVRKGNFDQGPQGPGPVQTRGHGLLEAGRSLPAQKIRPQAIFLLDDAHDPAVPVRPIAPRPLLRRRRRQ